MAKKKSKAGKTPIVVTTYARLMGFLEGFRDGNYNLIVLVGSWGIGKSRLVKEVLNGQVCWIEGNSTPFGMYSALYKNKDRPVVIDDVDSIYSDRHAVSLLKSICGTEPSKRVHWNARESFLQREGLPREFTTSSRVLIICNEWRSLNRNVSALEDRGLVFQFEPSPREIHERAVSWFKDAEIYEWFGKRLHRIEVHSFRHYIKAAQLKACGEPWRDLVLGSREKGFRLILVERLLADPSFPGNEERAKEFTKRGGGSRSTFYNYQRKLEAGM